MEAAPFAPSTIISGTGTPPPLADCLSFPNKVFVCISAAQFTGSSEYSVELDQQVRLSGCQRDAPWHLHYLAAVNRGQKVYAYDAAQPSTTIYIVDTWVETEHREFGGRVDFGASFAEGRSNPHGTHVAGLALGATVGVNRAARGVSVQVLDDSGRGSWSTILRGLDWVGKQRRKGVINISISGGASAAIDAAVNALADDGWRVVVAAGNDAVDACTMSPARATKPVTVGASNSNDELAAFSNTGRCVDVVAPGENVLSAYPGGRYAYMSGTSMAAPLVAGAWSLLPDLTASEAVRRLSRVDLLRQRQPATTTRRLLFVGPRDQCVIDQGPWEEGALWEPMFGQFLFPQKK